MFLNKLNNPKDPNGIFTDYTHRGWWRRFIRVASKEWKLIKEKEIKKERNSAYKLLIP